MNAMLSVPLPLPAVLDGTAETPRRRRHHIDPVELTDDKVGAFNKVLVRLGRVAPPLDCDRLATAARELCAGPLQVQTPPCIRQRLLRVKAAACMVGDRAWDTDESIRLQVRLVIDYVRDHDDLIPDEVPRVGRLDDAIVIDTVWAGIAEEVTGYLDFCRLRHRVAQHRGRPDPTFDRAAWHIAREDEAAWRRHCERVCFSSYLPATATRFLVH